MESAASTSSSDDDQTSKRHNYNLLHLYKGSNRNTAGAADHGGKRVNSSQLRLGKGVKDLIFKKKRYEKFLFKSRRNVINGSRSGRDSVIANQASEDVVRRRLTSATLASYIHERQLDNVSDSVYDQLPVGEESANIASSFSVAASRLKRNFHCLPDHDLQSANSASLAAQTDTLSDLSDGLDIDSTYGEKYDEVRGWESSSNEGGEDVAVAHNVVGVYMAQRYEGMFTQYINDPNLRELLIYNCMDPEASVEADATHSGYSTANEYPGSRCVNVTGSTYLKKIARLKSDIEDDYQDVGGGVKEYLHSKKTGDPLDECMPSEVGHVQSYTMRKQLVDDCNNLRKLFHCNSSPMFSYLISVMYIKLTQGISQRNISLLLNITGTLFQRILDILRPGLIKAWGQEATGKRIGECVSIFPKDKAEEGLHDNEVEHATANDDPGPLDVVNGIPNSYAKVCRRLAAIKDTVHTVPVCENNCMIFYGPDQDLNACKKCGSLQRGKNCLLYVSLKERIRRLFCSKMFCLALRQESERRRLNRQKSPNSIGDCCDGEAWARLENDGFFKNGGTYNLVFALVLDGVQAKKKKATSLWPIILSCLCLPSSLRSKRSFWTTFGIGTGHLKLGNMESYLRVFVEEMNDLFVNGVEVYNALTESFHTVKCALLFCSCDYPAAMSILNLKRYPCVYGCSKCMTLGTRVGRRTCYFRHFEYLPEDHPLRVEICRDLYASYNEDSALMLSYECAPERRDGKQVERAMECDESGKVINHDDTGVLGVAAYADLKGFDPYEGTINDVFHARANVGKRLLKTTKRSFDDATQRDIDKDMKRDFEYEDFLLTDEEQEDIDRMAMMAKSYPSGWLESPKPLYDRSEEHLKGHDVINTMFSDRGKYMYVKYLSPKCFKAYARLCDVDECIRKPFFADKKEIDQLQMDLYETFTELVLAFPPYLQSVSFTLYKHIPESIRLYGPVVAIQNYAAEHVMGDMAKNCHSSRKFAVEIMQSSNLVENLIWVILDCINPNIDEGSDVFNGCGVVANVLNSLLNVGSPSEASTEDHVDGNDLLQTYDRESGLYSMGMSCIEHESASRLRVGRLSKYIAQPLPLSTSLAHAICDTFDDLKVVSRKYSEARRKFGKTAFIGGTKGNMQKLCPRVYAALSAKQKTVVESNWCCTSAGVTALQKAVSLKCYSEMNIGWGKKICTSEYDARKYKVTCNSFISFLAIPWKREMEQLHRAYEHPISYGRVVAFVKVELLGEVKFFCLVDPITVLFQDPVTNMHIASIRDADYIPEAAAAGADADGWVDMNRIVPRNVVPYPMHDCPVTFKRLMETAEAQVWLDSLRSRGGTTQASSLSIPKTNMFYMGVFR